MNERIFMYGDILKHIEGLFVKNIFNELNSNTPIVQNTTLLLYEKYYKLNYKADGHISAILTAIITSIGNRNPGVSVQAAITLKYYIKKPTSMKLISTIDIISIINQILDLLKTHEYDELVNTLEIFVEQYPTHVESIALSLIQSLAQKFHEYYKPSIDDSDPHHKENSELYTNCINTLYNIVNAIKSNKELMGQAWPTIKSVLDRV
mmetsp:Transcript_51725/g.43468  ORF Transcript_51725/g.43468 Transcript_51725/m.43468 type:complete len:207 (+) Transcript_51725:1433-2053(+)